MNKIRIFDHPWHIGHQYEQLKFPWAEWTWLKNFLRQYNHGPRGNIEKYFNWVIDYEPGKYDVAILHLDQGCLEESILDRGKGSMYRLLNEVITDIPKIVIMHGTPYYPEKFANEQDMIDKANELIGDNYILVNSYRALEQWGWTNRKNARTLIHGMDPDEWWDLPKEPRVVTMISPGGFPAYYDRTFLDYVKDGLEERDIYHCHITVDWEAKDFDDYRNFLGRSLIYFNPTRESPMPRSRTEAMLSGACVITTPHQDADRFIKNGENGFIVKRNPEAVVKLIESLIMNPQKAVAIGQKGKETAKELFNWDRYQTEWYNFVTYVIEDYKKKHG
jgi:glycosyltransferase involved in cell wall biosynthesis